MAAVFTRRLSTVTQAVGIAAEMFPCKFCFRNNVKQFSSSIGFFKALNATKIRARSTLPVVHVRFAIERSSRDQYALIRSYCTSKPPDVSEIRNINPLGNIQSKVYYFDTLAVVQKLMAEGFTEKQAVAIKDIVQEVLHSSIDHQTKVLVTKAQMEITTQQMMTHINSVKKDMVILEKSEFSMLRSETEKQTMEIQQLKKALENELDKLKGHVRLDINLEKSRATEAHAQNEKNLQMLHNKIETDVANVRTLFESYKNDVFKYSIATALTAGATVLAVLRLLIH